MIKLHNTFTGRKETFEPSRPNEVRIYVCGVTPYDVSHLGHARCYVVFDVVRRVLRANGYKVRYVQNFTDVDDKIIARAAETSQAPKALAEKNIEDFFSKMDALGIERADVYPKVTEHIPEIQAMIKSLEDNGFAYKISDGMYYPVRRFMAYGKLSKRSLEELRSGARVEIDQEKKDPLDFALWKNAKPGEPEEVAWESSWGKGRPGWHIECSAMSVKHLGAGFDIHGGGLDLIFPHHENEIAQAEAATGKPFARYWMHNGFVTINKEKMSKSLGNFFSLAEIFAQYHPSVVRYMLLTVHYRSPLDFSQDLLEQSRNALTRMKDAVARVTRALHKKTVEIDETVAVPADLEEKLKALSGEYKEALADDFNTPAALGVLHQMLAQLEKQFSAAKISRKGVLRVLDVLRESSEILGINLFPRTLDVLIPREVSEWAQAREAARKEKNWAEADRLRKAISERGYVVEDTAQGPRLLPKADA
jgi:cysteinyl-tRNA synthetase